MSRSPAVRARPWSVQAQGLPRDRAELLKICTLGAKPLTYVSVGEPDVKASLLPNNMLVFP